MAARDAIREEIQALDTSARSLRQFGWLVGAVLLGLAAFVAWRTGGDLPTWAWGLGGVGGALVVLGTVAPRGLRLPYLGWMALAVVLGFVVSRVLLAVVFVGLVTPIGLVLRALGKTPLALRPDASETYWHARDDGAPDPARYERYF